MNKMMRKENTKSFFELLVFEWFFLLNGALIWQIFEFQI